MSVRMLSAVLGLNVLAACQTAEPPAVEIPPQQSALCSPGVSLGKVLVAPLAGWRHDQKEVEARQDIALHAIEAVTPVMPCAASTKILPIVPNSQADTRIVQARLEGATSIVFIRLEELGPVAVLSFPTLWSTWSDVKFTVDAVDVASGETLRSIPHRRREGGAYEGRGTAPLQGEMEQALKDVILGSP